MGRPSKGEQTLTEIVSESLKKSFDLNDFKKSKFLSKTIKFKEQKWIPLSPAMQNALSIPGIAIGHVNLLRGHSDTGKTTALIECAINAQKMGILPVFIITEMKWNWEHALQMGFEMEPVLDDEGNITDYKGFFIYVDRGSLQTIEDIAAFIDDLLNEQAKGKLPFDLVFLWDSVGSIPCRMSVEASNNNPQWNAGAMSQQFGNFINQRIVMSRKVTELYTNTLVVVNKIWVSPAENKFSQPKMRNKGGDTMFYDATLILTFGNVTNSGVVKIKATKNGKEVEWAKKTKVSCDKNHVNNITTKGVVVMTSHGFIEDEKKAIEKYKKEHSKEWLAILGESQFDIVEDTSEWEEDTNDLIETESE